MKLLPAIALACWGVAHILIMICTRHLGMDNPRDQTVEYGIRSIGKLKQMLPPGPYKVYVVAQVLFYVGTVAMGMWGLMGLVG